MVKLNRIEIIGAGPAGLYTAILLKSSMPFARVRVTEQNPADVTFGFGVVFSDKALDFLRTDDPETHALITPLMERWNDMTLSFQSECVILDGIGFAAIGRLQLLQLLQQRAVDLGVELRFNHAIHSIDELESQADLVVGADGLNSVLRRSCPAEFGAELEYFGNHFAWFGTPRPFQTLTQTFIRSEHGVFNAHHYRYSPKMSTFIVECDPASFVAQEFALMDEQESAETCSQLFRETLDGAPLLINKSVWRRFPRLWCEIWVHKKRVILGDAAHTAHFSIGSGTRLAFEDAIALIKALRAHDDRDIALAEFQQQRQPIVRKIVDAANTSASWYDGFHKRMELAPLDFAFDYLTRSGRVDLDRLRGISPGFISRYEQHISSK